MNDQIARTPGANGQDPRVPPAEACVLHRLLDTQVTAVPDREFIRFPDGESWTFAQARAHADRAEAKLRELGVAPGDRVLLWLPNGREIVAELLAVSRIGATAFPVNMASKGAPLEHTLRLADGRVLVAHSSVIARLNDIDPDAVPLVVTVGDGVPDLPDAIECVAGAYAEPGISTAEPARIQPWDPAMIMLTSGTTGPSKGVVMSHVHVYTTTLHALGYVEQDDVVLNYGSFCHIAGLITLYVTLMRAATLVLAETWKTEEFWPLVARHGVTVTGLLGSVIPFLVNLPECEEEKNNTLRRIYLVPLMGDVESIRQRYDVDIYSVWNMTETSVPLITDDNESEEGVCGRPRPGVELRLVDGNDCEVPDGEDGELIVRTDCPWAMLSEYFRNPEATARAWRNGWFHTGDVMRRDDTGRFHFVDRAKDCIRRRGENISSFELESVLLQHPAIANVAAIAVPSEFAEDEVMIIVQPPLDGPKDPESIVEFAAERLPHFMVPRFIRFVASLPMTPNNKVQKGPLREAGITTDTWDREAPVA
jgi:crotonobetaine/carnitine-CoA ligase